MVAATQPLTNSQNGIQTNGSYNHTRSSSSHFGLSSARKSFRSSGYMQSSALDDATVAIQRRSAKELGNESTTRVLSTDFMALVEWIHNERLMSLPKEGSSWDKVSTAPLVPVASQPEGRWPRPAIVSFCAAPNREQIIVSQRVTCSPQQAQGLLGDRTLTI